VADSILIYWPLWQLVSLWPSKPPQNKAKRTKTKKNNFCSQNITGLKKNGKISDGLSRRKVLNN
jgi:hypothetical protein